MKQGADNISTVFNDLLKITLASLKAVPHGIELEHLTTGFRSLVSGSIRLSE